MTTLPLLTILCPVHNEDRVIPLFFQRMRPVMEELSERYDVHLMFLNNASTDQTAQQIEKLSASWPNTYILTMSRNVGYQRSLACGLRHAVGQVFAFIDVDCEDPPEMILDFVEKYEAGFDIVYGERVDRHEPIIMINIRKLFYRLLQALADEEIILDMAEFSLFSESVRDAIIDENSSFPFIRASIGRVGFRRAAIPFKREKRIAGETHYNLMRMSIFALAAILSSSTLFLRLPIFFFPIWMLVLAGLGVGFIFTQSQWYLLGILLTAAGYLGGTVSFAALYIARTYKNGLSRPNAFIDQRNSRFQRIATTKIRD